MPTPIRGPQAADVIRRLGSPKATLEQIPANASAQDLKGALDRNWGAITTGRPPQIAKNEAAWLTQLAAHPNADASVKQAILDKTAGVIITDAAKTAGFQGILDGLKAELNPTTPTVPGGTDSFTTGGTTGGTTVPVTPPAGGGNAIDILTGNTGADSFVRGTNPVTFKGELSFPGAYKLTSDALADAYRGVDASKFGTTDVQLPGGKSVTRNDMVYDIGDGKVGMVLIPVSDHGTVTAPDGSQKPGHEVMDAHLRKEMGLGPDDPIFALINYVHPEEHSGDLKALGSAMVKTEMGNTHTGAYVGKGRTTNSPEDYHNNQWGNAGYPANVAIVQLAGVDQKTLNKNALICDTILNNDVQFPPDYKNDKFRTTDLNTTLMFYRDWIRDEPHLKNDPSWRTYCAEHKTIVTNIMLNVPHNEASFKEIFGDDGAKLWGDFKKKFEEVNGRAFTAADETSFEPLWKKEGLQPSQFKPWANVAEYNAYDKARHGGTLSSYTGPVPLDPGKGLAFPPETTADLLNDFLETYVPVKDVGAATSAAALMGFKDTIKDRMGIDDMTYLGHAVPVINKMVIADAMIRAENPGYAKQIGAELYLAFGGQMADLQGGTPNPQIMGLVEQCTQGLKQKLGDILQAHDPAVPVEKRQEAANAWLQGAIKPDLERARRQAVSDPGKTDFYAPPAIFHRVSIGMHESSKFVNIKTVATAVDSSELELK